ncbi:MAG: methyltransferase domain-containing protein [Gemmatimonadaceae bacterium]
MSLKSLANFHDPSSLASRMRRRRFALFRDLAAELPFGARVLDIGGTPEFWREIDLVARGQLHVTLLNIESYTSIRADIELIQGDARDMQCFHDQAFDAVFSNSVIEHVGSFADQQRMASEVRRVAPRYFIQTPNRYFPLEPHFLIPCFQFFPRALQIRLVQRYKLGWMPRRPDYEAARREVEQVRLMSASEMRALFPDGELYREKIGGLTKSLVSFGGWRERDVDAPGSDA